MPTSELRAMYQPSVSEPTPARMVGPLQRPGKQRLRKRVLDVLGVFLLCTVMLWWLLPLLAAVLWLFHGSPVLFTQIRVGYKGRQFRCYKFCTQVADGERGAGHLRFRGRLGQFLQRTSLDELPQFWNVLRGDMSIVGPRPHALPFHNEYVQYYNEIDLRHAVKPGITGLAQVLGCRGDVSDPNKNRLAIRKRIRYDLLYIRKWSVALDCWIMLKTITQMFGGRR